MVKSWTTLMLLTPPMAWWNSSSNNSEEDSSAPVEARYVVARSTAACIASPNTPNGVVAIQYTHTHTHTHISEYIEMAKSKDTF